jgi:uncharacterized membrane protein
MNKNRLEMFTDGVFAIAATILVLHVTVNAPGNGLSRALVHAWPQYAAYALAFLLIGIWWVNHHAYMSVISHVDRPFLFGHVTFLMCIAFIPFPTNLVAEHFHDQGLHASVFVLGVTGTAAASCMAFLWFHAARGRRLISEEVDQRLVNRYSREVASGPPSMAATALLALWLPYLALAIFSTAALYYLFGSSFLGRNKMSG